MQENKVHNTMESFTIESFKLNSAPKIRLQVINQAGWAHGVGRRKSSVAKAWVRAGEGKFTLNGIEINQYFKAQTHLAEANRSLSLIEQKFDVIAFSKGGGHTGQSGALSLAISNALVAYNPQYYTILRSFGLMTCDNRQVERKKAGLDKARKAKPTSRR